MGATKEKVPAPTRGGTTRVVLPERNRRDVEEIPKHLLDGLELVYVDTIEDALAQTLAPAAA